MAAETDDLPRVPPALRWASWALVVVAVLVPVVLLVVHQRVFAGALDQRYFPQYAYDGTTGGSISPTRRPSTGCSELAATAYAASMCPP